MCCETHNVRGHGGCCDTHHSGMHRDHCGPHHFETRDGCCAPDGMHAHGSHGCCGQHGFVRMFTSKSERLAELEAYRDELSKELEGVNEHMAEMSKG
jgi:hypothetical protein